MSYFGNEYERRTLMNIEALYFQKYFYFKHLNQSSSEHRVTYWVKLSRDIELHRLMYALLDVVQNQPVLRTQFVTDDFNQLKINLRDFFPFIEIQEVNEMSQSIDLEAFFTRNLNSYHFNQLPLFNFKIYQFLDEAYLLLDFHATIFNESQLTPFLQQVNIAYTHSLKSEYSISDFYNWIKEMNQKMNQNQAECPSKHFNLLNADGDNYAYIPVKNTCEKKKMCSLHTELPSLDIDVWIVSIYLAHHFISQSSDVTLGIHFSIDNKNTENMMVLNTDIAPLNLSISQSDAVKDMVDECSALLEELQMCGASFVVQPKAVQTDVETMIHIEKVQEQFELNHICHHIHRLYNEASSLADLEFYPHVQGGFDIVYNDNVYDDLTVHTLVKLINGIYMQITQNPSLLIKDIKLSDRSDLAKYNDINFQNNDINYSEVTYKSVVERFERQVHQHPDSIALQYEQQSMTYHQLNQCANLLAYKLRLNNQIEPNDMVALIAERSLEMIIGMLGILKAGAGYIPIDPDYPEERINYIIEDAKPKAILTYHTSFQSDLPQMDIEFIVGSREQEIDDPRGINCSEDIAYVIYTSGTTGKPKGTLVPHRGIDRLVHNPNYVELNENTAVLLSGTVAFDAATFEIYGPLLNGGRLVITSKDTLLNPQLLDQAITENKVNTMWLTSSLFNQIASERIEALESLTYLLIGGEVLNAKWVHLLNSRECHPQIINGYGPTENTTFTTTFAIPQEMPSRIPIGLPISGTTVYVMQGERICGVGVPGELCIGGAGLAKGYLNQPKLTAERFIQSPFNNEMLYRSGDLVRLQEDGNIDYISRIDKQVKIRGFRIELSEIEKALEAIRDINKAVVIVREQDQDKQIVAYYEASQLKSTGQLKDILSGTLPEYMIPVHFMKVDRIPITMNGKLDVRALPEINLKNNRNYVEPRNDIERTVCRIFEEILHIDQVGIKDNFFELGGHSLRATLVVNRIEERLKKRLKVGDLMKSPTVEQLGQQIEELQNDVYDVIPKANESYQYDLSASQKSMYLLWKVNPKDTVYNIPFLWRLSSELNVMQLQRALSKLIERHEILRTQYVIDDNEVKQRIATHVLPDFEEVTTSLTNEQDIIQSFMEPFDLEQPSQMRVKYIHGPQQDYLFMDTHHSINDGMSNTILLSDLNALYQDKSLPELKLQYKDYSEWMVHRDLSKQRHFWLQQFENQVPILNMPTDYPRPSIKTTNGNMLSFHYNHQIKQQLKSYVEQHQVTDFMFFASAIMVLLHKYTRQDDIAIGSVISARTHRDTENMLGMFANTLVYRGRPHDQKTWDQLMAEMKEMCLGAYEHQEYPFESLVNDLVDERDASHNPLFDVMLVLQNNETNHANFGHSQLTHIPPQSTTAKFDMSFIIEEDQDGYVVNIEYNTDLYKQETIHHIAEQLQMIIKHVISTENLKIQDIDENDDLLIWLDKYVNDCSLDLPKNKSIQQLLHDVMKAKADDVALKMNGQSMTYQELDDYSNSIAQTLIHNGIQKGERVALLTERSFEMVASMIAVLKVGGSYVPIDVTYPDKRIEFIIKDAEVAAVLTYGKTISSHIPVIKIEDIDNTENNKRLNIEYAGNLEDDLYHIYTSGTTGKPKAVSVKQRNILNLVCAWTKRLNLSDDEVYLQYANYVFDASATDFYCSLLNGYPLVIATSVERTNTDLLEKLISQENITIASIPLQVYNVMHHFYIPKVITGGATSTPAFVQHISKHCDMYVNAYGPSENTVIASCWIYKKGDAIPSTIPIGKPLANVDIFIMSGGKLCGVGIPGELCIAGESLTSGYLNRPELSAEKFIENPFGPGQLYRSGDLARLMPDGQIEFLGRIDKQVKVHGYRIELGEIENIINSVDTVTDSVVILAKQSEREVLHAYYVGSQEDENHISQHLNQYLPKYMIPKTLTAISEIPLTGNDKVDESKLPVPNVHKNKFAAPRNNIEREIAQIVSGVLDVSSMSIDDDFFEMGGTSLDAMVVVSKLKSNGIHITMQDVYQFKTVRYIANHTETRQALPEVVLPDHLPQLQSLVERRYQLKPQHLAQSSLGHVLLTGATGFLGAYLIDEMQDNADQITCIVRGHDINQAKTNLENNLNCYFDMAHVDKLMKHIDIVLADLSELDHLIIDSAIDTIIHAGARTDHFGDDETFFDVNVRSTQALIDLAKDKKAKLIYISTISVGTVFKAHQDDISFSEKDLYKGQLFTSPYTKSKFYSEIKVLEAVNEGLAAQIIRLGNLTSASTGPLNMKNLTTNRFSIVMHDLLKMPFIGESISKAKVEFSFIDVTARHIIKLARSNAIPIIYHVYAPRSITMKQVIDNAKGSEMTVVSDSEFEQKLHELGMHELIGLNSNGDNQISGVTDSNMTQTVMKELQGEWPHLSCQWLQQWYHLLFEKFDAN